MMQQINQQSPLNAQLINSVVNATIEVLATMAFTQVSFKEAQAEKDYRPAGDVSAVIGIFGDQGEEGMMVISFSSRLAQLIVSRLLGVGVDSLSSDDMSDGVRELVNMISGGTKAALSQSSGSLYRLTLPTVVLGKNHEISNRPSNNPYLHILFETEGETFSLQVAFKPKD
jgi:chemotaxis protein CheX